MDLTWVADVARRPRNLAVGEFDGVHLGHREVMRGADTVVTFEPHPWTVIAPEYGLKLLTTLQTKADLIASLGLRELVVVPFDGALAEQPAQDFIDEILIGRLDAQSVSVGENFRFGRRASGDIELLRAQTAFRTRVAELVSRGGQTISSTRIRALVEGGDMRNAAADLGAPFQLRGIVTDGDKRGRTLGFPTANLVPNHALVCPPYGVYACRAHFLGPDGWESYTAATSIGVRPTFVTGRGLLVEAFLLDFSGDLYGRELRLEFIERLRGEVRFDDVDELIAQMHADVRRAREIVD